MSLTAAALKLMADKGLSAHDLAEIAAANERAPDSAAEKRRTYDRERKRLLRDGGFDEARNELFANENTSCAYCSDSAGPFHADHKIPLSRGGSSDLENLVISCARCNLDKGARAPDEWQH